MWQMTFLTYISTAVYKFNNFRVDTGLKKCQKYLGSCVTFNITWPISRAGFRLFPTSITISVRNNWWLPVRQSICTSLQAAPNVEYGNGRPVWVFQFQSMLGVLYGDEQFFTIKSFCGFYVICLYRHNNPRRKTYCKVYITKVIVIKCAK